MEYPNEYCLCKRARGVGAMLSGLLAVQVLCVRLRHVLGTWERRTLLKQKRAQTGTQDPRIGRK